MKPENPLYEKLLDSIAELRGLSDDNERLESAADSEDPIARNLHALAHIASFDPVGRGRDSSLGTIGPYELLERVGVGGMGEVFRARQTDPLRRIVAVKVIKAGMDSARVLQRFEVERQTLAMMDHPYIAKAFDAGATEAGRPFFVMEFVPGISLTRWCDSKSLSVAERLEIFLDVLGAIQYAHFRGVIHRDLKPSNVLVNDLSGRPIPKIIDFGIAKATELELAGGTLLTEEGQLLGTPEYMSPEQAMLKGGAVDTRSDVYTLGVMLYEVMTGTLPFPSKELRAHGLMEIPRILQTREPKSPSTVADEEASSKLRGDLDWIILKALEKDPERRYASPGEFANDIRRHLRNHPVIAGPPSTIYRFRKFARRNRGVVIATGAIAALLISGIITTSRQAIRARLAESVAREKSNVAETVNSFLIDMLSQANPNTNPAGREMTVGEVLDEAAFRIDEDFEAPLVVEAAIRQTIGRAYSALDRYDQADRHLERSVFLSRAEGEPAALIRALREFSIHCSRQGENEKADSLAFEELAVARVTFGDRSEPSARAILRLAKTRTKLNEPAEADSLFREGFEILASAAPGRESSEALHDYARFLIERGRIDEAERTSLRTHELMESKHGTDHPFTAAALDLLASTHKERGDLEGSLKIRRRTQDIIRSAYGDQSREMLIKKQEIGQTLVELGRPDEARPILEESVATGRLLYGDRHPFVAQILGTLAFAHLRLGEVEKANEINRDVLEILREARGDHPSLFSSINDLASTVRRLGKPAEAESLFAEAIIKGRSHYGGEHAMLAIVTSNLAKSRTDQGKFEEAAATYKDAIAMAERTFPPGRAEIDRIRSNYGECLLRMGRFAEAEQVLLRAWEGLHGKVDPGHSWFPQIAGWLMEATRGQGDEAAASEWEMLQKSMDPQG